MAFGVEMIFCPSDSTPLQRAEFCIATRVIQRGRKDHLLPRVACGGLSWEGNTELIG